MEFAARLEIVLLKSFWTEFALINETDFLAIMKIPKIIVGSLYHVEAVLRLHFGM